MSYYEDWIPEEHDSPVSKLFLKTSAVESLAEKYPIRSDTYDLEYDVLRTEKFGNVTELSLEDVYNTDIDIVSEVRMDFARNSGVYLDSVCLGAQKSPVDVDRWYEWGATLNHLRAGRIRSLYVRENLNRFPVDSENPGDLVGLVSGLAEYVKHGPPIQRYSYVHNMDARPGIIAHPKFRNLIDPKRTGTVAGLPVKWSLGCAVTEEPSHNPEGNPLLYVGNVSALKLGVRSGPESHLSLFDQRWADEVRRDGDSHRGFNVDPEAMIRDRFGKAWLKTRIRRAFTVDPRYPFQCIELT